MAAIPATSKRYGRVELPYVNGHNMMPVGLGPCSQCVHVYQRHHEGGRCWGAFPTEYHLQGDTSLQCARNSYNLSQFSGYYTAPQGDGVYVQDVDDDDASVAQATSSVTSTLQLPSSVVAGTGPNVPRTSAAAGLTLGPQYMSSDMSLYSTNAGYVADVQYPNTAAAPAGADGSQSGNTLYDLWTNAALFSRPFF